MLKLFTAFALMLAIVSPADAAVGAGKAAERRVKEAIEDMNAGVEALNAGDNAGAVQYFTEAIDSGVLQPDNLFNAYLARGSAYERLGQCNNAIPDFTAAAGVMPQDARPYAQRGNCHATLKQIPQAIADLKQAVALDPAEPGYGAFLCAVAYNNKVWPEAGPACDAAFRAAPTDKDLAQAAAASWEMGGDNARANALWKALLALDPNSQEAKDGIARTT